MATHKVKITQVTRVEREITVEIEGESPELALEAADLMEAPANDAGWAVTRDDLMSQTEELA